MMTAATVMSLLGTAASVSYPIGYRVLVDAALRHDAARVVVGVSVVAVLFSAGWLLQNLAVAQSSPLTDTVNVYHAERIATLVNDIPGLRALRGPRSPARDRAAARRPPRPGRGAPPDHRHGVQRDPHRHHRRPAGHGLPAGAAGADRGDRPGDGQPARLEDRQAERDRPGRRPPPARRPVRHHHLRRHREGTAHLRHHRRPGRAPPPSSATRCASPRSARRCAGRRGRRRAGCSTRRSSSPRSSSWSCGPPTGRSRRGRS